MATVAKQPLYTKRLRNAHLMFGQRDYYGIRLFKTMVPVPLDKRIASWR
uniref:MIP05956p n=1 Tax=Drosophila melanogaster TaxID=7227 RepID=C0PDE3_DROME|nr:MIP05956p [Drosophila melanogaster]